MVTFQVVSRIVQAPASLKKRRGRFHRVRVSLSGIATRAAIVFLLVITLFDIVHVKSDYVFILIPVILSLFTLDPRRYTHVASPLGLFLHSKPLYLVFSFFLALVYYSAITTLELLTHNGPNVAHIILVTTAIAWVILLEPVRAWVQSLIERRFNVRDRERRMAVDAFTATLREEINLDQLRERFLAVSQRAVQASSVALWVRAMAQQEQAGSSGMDGREQAGSADRQECSVAGDDAFMAYVLHHPGVVEIDRLHLESPLLQDAKARLADIALPLANRGELLGLLALGPRLDGEEYSSDDRALLTQLADQVAPALRVAYLVQEREEQVRERERTEAELRTARAIQHAFLPKDVPALPGWQLIPYYQPAREVGGDFYDVFAFDDGRVGLVIGDVTGKGVPAALVMATAHTTMRTVAQGTVAPAEILARVNERLCAEMPAGMFVTCFYALLDPRSGHLRYANAGQTPPFRRHDSSATELWATGMPLGMMPTARYDEHAATLCPGESLVLYSDGLVEAHNPRREMFGCDRLQSVLAAHDGGTALIDAVLSALGRFTGARWEQEDDVTLLAVHRASAPPS